MRTLLVASSLMTASLAPSLSHAAAATDVAGVPASLVGVHGPTENYLQNLELVGATDLRLPTEATKALGNNGGVALIGDCAYVGRWHDYNAGTKKRGVQVVDVSDPSNPTRVGDIAATISAGGVAREIRAIDLPNFKILTVLIFSQATGDRANNKMLFFTVGEDCTQPTLAGTFSLAAIRGHEFFQWLDPDPAHNVNGHPRVLEFITTPITNPSVLVLDASDPTRPIPVGGYDAGLPVASTKEPTVAGAPAVGAGTYAHSISVSHDGREAYVSYWDGGYITIDTSAFALGGGGTAVPKGAMSIPLAYPAAGTGNTHSAVRAPGSDIAVVGDEVYITTDGCPFGWLHTIDIGDEATPAAQVGELKLAENDAANCDPTTKLVKSRNALGLDIDGTFTMHNQTVTKNYVLTSWYGGGVRVIDITDPARPAEAGVFVPKPAEAVTSNPDTPAPPFGLTTSQDDDWWVATWSYPVIRDGLIYVSDIRSGLYILRPSAGAPFAAEVGAIGFLEGNSNFGGFVS